jgi:hypothetical protein
MQDNPHSRGLVKKGEEAHRHFAGHCSRYDKSMNHFGRSTIQLRQAAAPRQPAREGTPSLAASRKNLN